MGNAAIKRVLSSPARAADPVKRNEAYGRLLLDIICRKLPPGSDLDERVLARRYKTGIASIREALFRLSLERVVHRWPRIGTRVADLSVFELEQVFEARLSVEVSCARLAAQMATAEDLAEIREGLAGWRAAIEARDYRTLVLLDQQFHRALAQATHNEVLIPIVHMLHNSALRFWYFTLPRRPISDALAGMEKHSRVLQAVESRDVAAAEAAMRELIRHFKESGGILGSMPSAVPE